ncbi:hypothetical protein AYI68_g7225 [Smittium mucronatum]|uniref:Sorting nexin/Vps5-like C-terminal domain-containing protein n=1 Tax=Smittium mucronatum TaxID=133383 RepID=A0A1R0GPB8_9FUNG|nr:hypothetical protein AYI68_g7225 [Smittium mucronatum]
MARVKIHDKWQSSYGELARKKKLFVQSLGKSGKRSFLGISSDAGNGATSNPNDPQNPANERNLQLQREINRFELQVTEMGKSFELVNQTLSEELDRFDEMRISAFQEAIEQHLVGMIEIQDEIVGLWDKFGNSSLLKD